MENQLANYKKDGYVLLRGFWNTADLDDIHLQAKQIFAAQIKRTFGTSDDIVSNGEVFDSWMFKYFAADVAGFVNCGKQAQHLISLHRLSLDKKLVDLLKNLGLDFPIISVRPSMFFNSRMLDNTGNYWKLDSHQDWRSSQGSLDSVTAWFPYVDCNKDLGALEIIAGSHLTGLKECEKVDYYSRIKQGEVDENSYTPVEMKKGDLLLFSSFLVHRSGTNVTQRIRWSTQFRYNNINEETFIERKFPNPFTYKPFEDLVTPDFPRKGQLADLFREK